jgi:dipeptidyl aminopeptidase/acylaminoacyl peptidase
MSVIQVDGRGTGFQGRKYRVGVRGRLGELEVIDQVNAGRYSSFKSKMNKLPHHLTQRVK